MSSLTHRFSSRTDFFIALLHGVDIVRNSPQLGTNSLTTVVMSRSHLLIVLNTKVSVVTKVSVDTLLYYCKFKRMISRSGD